LQPDNNDLEQQSGPVKLHEIPVTRVISTSNYFKKNIISYMYSICVISILYILLIFCGQSILWAYEWFSRGKWDILLIHLYILLVLLGLYSFIYLLIVICIYEKLRCTRM
jgi:hypothetical protein